jgi:hypothetical protein
MPASHTVRESSDSNGSRVSFFRKTARIGLEIPGIFFVGAFENFRRGCNETERLNRKLNQFETLRARVSEMQLRVRRLRQGRHKAAKEIRTLEDLETDLLQDLRKIEMVFAPVVQSFATAYILLVASGEAFINEAAEIELSGKTWEEFDKLSPVGKWLFLPRVLGFRKTFKLNKDPLQGFAEAVRRRHRFIHHKPRTLPLVKFDAAWWLRDMGLTPKDFERSFKAVQLLIREFSLAWKGAFGPNWLYPDEDQFRRPCFFIGNREFSALLASEELDGDTS